MLLGINKLKLQESPVILKSIQLRKVSALEREVQDLNVFVFPLVGVYFYLKNVQIMNIAVLI